MPRTRPQGRFDHLVRAAARSFILARGYQATQMDDLAAQAGVSKGALYGYFENKAAVLDQALRYGDYAGVIPEPSSLPVRDPGIKETVRYLGAEIAKHPLREQLQLYLEYEAPRGGIHEELHAIVALLFNTFWEHRIRIKLIDVCAKDHPDLAQAWFGPGREAILKLLRTLIEKRIGAGHLRRIPHAGYAARFVLESCVFWAVHVHWDPHPENFERDVVLRSLQRFLSDGLAGAYE